MNLASTKTGKTVHLTFNLEPICSVGAEVYQQFVTDDKTFCMNCDNVLGNATRLAVTHDRKARK